MKPVHSPIPLLYICIYTGRIYIYTHTYVCVRMGYFSPD